MRKSLEYIQQAKLDLNSGKLNSAIKHVGKALWLEPINPDYLALAYEILDGFGYMLQA